MYTRAVLKREKPESDQADASFQYLTAWYTCQYSVADIPQRVKGKYEMLKCYAKTADNFDWHVWEKKKCNTWGIFCGFCNHKQPIIFCKSPLQFCSLGWFENDI